MSTGEELHEYVRFSGRQRRDTSLHVLEGLLEGLPGASASEVKRVDPKTLLYSLATISDELPALDPQHKAKEGDLGRRLAAVG